ncbi:MAG TPA: HAD family phosphatase [Candidatus Saccharimonadales bacterium]|nr:HAD family phosphatase [Candidatus Saccharimonadales bacterium]
MSKSPARGVKVAAFFDLDGTLLPEPSLERRFHRVLRYRREIGFWNYVRWFSEALRLLPRGVVRSFEENKMYLRGVACARGCERGRLPRPEFFEQGVQHVAWHVRSGHEVVLVSGTLDFLAAHAAERLQARLAKLGISVVVHVRATQLRAKDCFWTGSVAGPAVFGREKGRVVERLAAEMELDLENCFAYGNSAHDRWMLGAVGNAVAVNPSMELQNIAELLGWRVVRWDGAARRPPAGSGRKESRTAMAAPSCRDWKRRTGNADLENAG